MRLFPIIVAAVAASLSVTAAAAQTCYTYGEVTNCSDGSSAYHYGTGVQNNDRPRNPTPMYGGGFGSTYSGNGVISNDGQSAYSYGDAIVTNDGRTCYRYGTALICDRGYSGLTPSYSR